MTPSGVMWRVSPVQYWRAALDVSPSQKAGAHVHVATTHFLKTLIANVSGEGESPASVVGNSIKDTTRKERRSAVAIVMRVVQQRKKQQSAMEPVSSPVHPVIQNSSGEVELSSRNRSLDAILEHASGLEILFISRESICAHIFSTAPHPLLPCHTDEYGVLCRHFVQSTGRVHLQTQSGSCDVALPTFSSNQRVQCTWSFLDLCSVRELHGSVA
eukprot:1832537-Rhodomonas_salina.1